VNVIAPIFTNDKGLFLQTIYYPLQLFASNVKGSSLALAVDAPTYKTIKFDSVPYVDASASVNGDKLVLNVVNRHRDQSMAIAIELEDKRFICAATVAEVSGPDIKAENDFGKTLVQTTTRSIAANGNKLNHDLPPHSFTQIRSIVT
jgi:alpha-N-arabinofuranosidase